MGLEAWQWAVGIIEMLAVYVPIHIAINRRQEKRFASVLTAEQIQEQAEAKERDRILEENRKLRDSLDKANALQNQFIHTGKRLAQVENDVAQSKYDELPGIYNKYDFSRYEPPGIYKKPIQPEDNYRAPFKEGQSRQREAVMSLAMAGNDTEISPPMLMALTAHLKTYPDDRAQLRQRWGPIIDTITPSKAPSKFPTLKKPDVMILRDMQQEIAHQEKVVAEVQEYADKAVQVYQDLVQDMSHQKPPTSEPPTGADTGAGLLDEYRAMLAKKMM